MSHEICRQHRIAFADKKRLWKSLLLRRKFSSVGILTFLTLLPLKIKPYFCTLAFFSPQFSLCIILCYNLLTGSSFCRQLVFWWCPTTPPSHNGPVGINAVYNYHCTSSWIVQNAQSISQFKSNVFGCQV